MEVIFYCERRLTIYRTLNFKSICVSIHFPIKRSFIKSRFDVSFAKLLSRYKALNNMEFHILRVTHRNIRNSTLKLTIDKLLLFRILVLIVGTNSRFLK